MKQTRFFLLVLSILVLLLVTSCASTVVDGSEQTAVDSVQSTKTPTLALETTEPPDSETDQEPTQINTTELATTEPEIIESVTATPDIRLDPDDWKNWPVVPTISSRALEIYRQGLTQGNDPTHFSKIGDCQNVTSYFLADFDRNRYTLGENYDYLQDVIDHYAGSWGRDSLAVKGGFNVASVLNPMMADPDLCESNESPIACELRVNQPSIVIISLETWWNHDDPTKYEFYMRKILDEVIAFGALPIIATKADNLEGDHIINQSIAQLAYEYDIPMWNFWAAADALPEHGLTEDGFHLTLGLGNYFDNPDNFAGAWPIRNLTALQSMDAVYQAVNTMQP